MEPAMRQCPHRTSHTLPKHPPGHVCCVNYKSIMQMVCPVGWGSPAPWRGKAKRGAPVPAHLISQRAYLLFTGNAWLPTWPACSSLMNHSFCSGNFNFSLACKATKRHENIWPCASSFCDYCLCCPGPIPFPFGPPGRNICHRRQGPEWWSSRLKSSRKRATNGRKMWKACWKD